MFHKIKSVLNLISSTINAISIINNGSQQNVQQELQNNNVIPPVPIITDVTNFRYRNSRNLQSIRSIVIHWTGGQNGARAGVNFAGSENSKGWYHYILDKQNCFQCVVPPMRAAHAGPGWNDVTIGIATAHPIAPGSRATSIGRPTYISRLESILERYRALGYDIEARDYSSNDFPKVISLDVEHAKQIVGLVNMLCDNHGIPKILYTSKRNFLQNTRPNEMPQGVVFHHQLTSNKWDCIPWIETFAEEFRKANFQILE
jgi:hypothetical protein